GAAGDGRRLGCRRTGKTWEAGIRGRTSGPVALSWSMAAYRTDLKDDILFTATESGGAGFFTNVDKTRRQGLEFSLRGRAGPVQCHNRHVLVPVLPGTRTCRLWHC
ncbi:MAG: TonB-dependent receptor, partial [Rhodospirillales bacterium]|nr:TonB-dependent receptor [Rhodospirillales bacterium]